MMDDNSEAQMETDVSSTTIDVPEIKEVTGTTGNMEMVIVVEKLLDGQTLPDVQEQANAEEAAPIVSKQSTQDSDNSAPNENALSQTCERNLPELDEGNKIEENQDVTLVEKVNKSPSKSNQTALASTDVPRAILSAVPMQSLEVIPDSSSTGTNKDIEICEKEKDASGYDHQLSLAKDIPIQMEQCNQKTLEHKESFSAVTNMDHKTENSKSTENEPISKMDVGLVSLDDSVDASNDSQMETGSEVSEKDHNKSISRELKSLIKSAKESKIISECTQLTSKTRKSRTTLDNANTSLTSLVEAEKIQGTRRNSTNSQKSNCSEKSDKAVIKRSMRSQNPEFVNKVKQFLNSVTGKIGKTDSETISDEEIEENKSKENLNDSTNSTPKKKKVVEEQHSEKTNKLRSDPYCWRCHWAVEQPLNEKTHHPMHCTVCPRTFHFKCLSGTERNKINTEKNWVCPECLLVLHAESSETRSPAMKKVTLGALCELLKYALERMMDLNGVEPFMHPVDRTAFPDYDKYVVHPMDLTLMKNNITEGLYGSTEAFIADAQWILHNSIIFNTLQSKLTGGARALVRSCRAEMGEIEACPECYAAAHARRPTWFTDVCTTPHVLLWAKLKGFPHWPAKGMTVNSSGLVDVRFFGAHDRAWVPAKDCYLYSEKDPNNFRTKRQDIIDSMQEAEQHIRNISRKYGKFVYPPFKTQFDPTKLAEQIKMMIPSFEGEVRSVTKEKSVSTPQSKEKSRSNSKSSKSSINDGDMSEGEDSHVEQTRKMADGAEIAKEEEDFTISEKNKSTESNVSLSKKETSRKRRRSDLEEAVITILESSGSAMGDKCRRVNELETENIKGNEELKEKNPLVEGSIEQVEKAAEQLNKEKNKEKEPLTDTNEMEKLIDSTPVKPSRPKPMTRTSTPKDSAKDKKQDKTESCSTPKRPVRNDKASVEKDDKTKTHKRSNSKNKSTNGNSEKSERNGDKKIDRNTDSPVSNKEKRDSNATNKNKETDSDKNLKKCIVPVKVTTDSPKIKERNQVDDDTVLADLARETNNSIIGNSASGLPTISSVRSLLVPLNDNPNPKSNTIEVTIDSESCVFTPTSTDTIRNMKEAANKLQRLKGAVPPPVGRVGVRAFARITSPEQQRPEPMQVEIKSEPIDIDDSDRQSEKMDLMNAFKLRPVNQTMTNNLRDVRINKVVVAPINARKTATKPPDMRVRAKKTFPQPKKPDDGRSELNGKNSMVYIPIQPPVTQAPVRGVRPMTVNGPTNSSTPRMPAPTITSASGINTVTSPLIPHSLPSNSNSVPTTTATSTVLATMSGLSTVGQLPSGIPTVGQVPTNVHTVPLITSVNGQWTFSLQPVMSVGGVDDSPAPIVNGITERTNQMALPSQLAHLTALSSPAPPNTSASASASASAPATVTPLPNATGNRNDTPAELPRLQQRPPLLNPLDASTPMGCVPPPSTAGPLTAKLNQNAVKLTDFFRTLLEDSLEKIDEPASQLTAVKLQLEQTKWRHQQEIDEIKHNHELVLAEMRASFEKEKIRAVNDVRRASQVELEAAVKLAKSKQWCANCSQEAQFYCCWNTSYCDYPCQRAHWSQHYAVCTQQRSQDSNNTENGGPPHDNANQSSDNLPKSTQAPALTVGNKLTPLRVFSQDPTSGQKSSIIVSMVEDSSGNQTMKCVGTYKPNAPPQLSPLNINKQIITTDESAKKVVTSGGYLIVGTGAAGSGNLVTSRRPHTIQYYT